jgi:hypothetical protein
VNERVLRSASEFENGLKISSWEASARAGGDDRSERWGCKIDAAYLAEALILNLLTTCVFSDEENERSDTGVGKLHKNDTGEPGVFSPAALTSSSSPLRFPAVGAQNRP